MEPEVFATALHSTLSWARWIQSTQSPPVSLRYILVLSNTYFFLLKSLLYCLTTPSGYQFFSLSGGPGAYYQPEDRLLWILSCSYPRNNIRVIYVPSSVFIWNTAVLSFSRYLVSTWRRIPNSIETFCHDYFLPLPSQFIIHYHPAIRRYVIGVFDIVVDLKGGDQIVSLQFIYSGCLVSAVIRNTACRQTQLPTRLSYLSYRGASLSVFTLNINPCAVVSCLVTFVSKFGSS